MAVAESSVLAPPSGSGVTCRKKLDPRLVTLINNGVGSGQRSFFVVIGDHGRDQVVNLHFLLSKGNMSMGIKGREPLFLLNSHQSH